MPSGTITGTNEAASASRAAARISLRYRLALEAEIDQLSRRVAGRLRSSILNAARRKEPLQAVTAAHFGQLEEVMLVALTAGHIEGDSAVKRRFSARKFSAVQFAETDRFIRMLNKVTARAPGDLDRLRAMYEDEARRSVRVLNAAVENGLVSVGSDDIQAIRKKLDVVGIGYEKPHLLQTAIRTQLHLGYSAGKLDTLQTPLIQDELWGFEYVGILDDRIRPTHAALDGVRLPKENPAWSRIMPPNGYNCRCDVIEVWFGESTKEIGIPTGVTFDGDPVQPGPDPGWSFSPSVLVRAA